MSKIAIERKLKCALENVGYTLYTSHRGYWCNTSQCRYMVVRTSTANTGFNVRFKMSLADVYELVNWLYSV